MKFEIDWGRIIDVVRRKIWLFNRLNGNIRHRIIMKKEVITWLRRIVIGIIGVHRLELEQS